MTTARFAHTQVLSVRENVNGKKTVTYHGKGYTYHLHKTTQDIWAKLQIARDTLKKFIKSVGACNTVQLPGLNVCDQGVGGWFEIFVIDERKLFSVVNFLKRLNRWMLGSHHIGSGKKKFHYFVEVKKFRHTIPSHLRQPAYHERPPVKPIPYTSPAPVQANVVPIARLEQLAATVNARFGH